MNLHRPDMEVNVMAVQIIRDVAAQSCPSLPIISIIRIIRIMMTKITQIALNDFPKKYWEKRRLFHHLKSFQLELWLAHVAGEEIEVTLTMMILIMIDH